MAVSIEMDWGAEMLGEEEPDVFVAKCPGVKIEDGVRWVIRYLAEKLAEAVSFWRKVAVHVVFAGEGGVEVDVVEGFDAA